MCPLLSLPSCGCWFNPAPYSVFSLRFPTVSSTILLSQCASLILTFSHLPPGLCPSVPVSLSLFCTVAACPLSFCLSSTPHISCFLFLSINLFTDCLLHRSSASQLPWQIPLISFPLSLLSLCSNLSLPRLPLSLLSLVVLTNHCLDYLCLPVSLFLFLFFSLFRSILPSLRFWFISSFYNSLSWYFCQGSTVLHSISLCLCLFCAVNPLSSCLSLNLCMSSSTSTLSFCSSAFWQEF